ncbi:hypothetical protein ACOMHN_048778 [Nucella lapillus]
MASVPGVITESLEDFSQERLLSYLWTCVSGNGDVSVDTYIAGIEELCKLLKRFEEDNLEFVLPEILVNLSLLKDYREGKEGEEYSTVQRMIDYELRHNLVQTESRPSGTGAVLRFHHTLEFIHDCLQKIQDTTISDEAFPGEIVKIYTGALELFHPELMTVSVQWALPTFIMSRVSLVEGTGFAGDPPAFWGWLKEVSDNLQRLNGAVRSVYQSHQLFRLTLDSL